MFDDMVKVKDSKSFSICAENFTGEKGGGGKADKGTGDYAARELGKGWKISPSVNISAHSSFTMGEINKMGKITHIWLTTGEDRWQKAIIKMFWDGSEKPSVCCPLGSFFCNGWGKRSNVNSLLVTDNPAGGFNCYFPMPFKKSAKIVMENISDEDMILYYQIDFEECDVLNEDGYFHAEYRLSNPLEYMQVHTILDGVKGRGQYIGTYLGWQVNNNGWWGEGEIKFYMDGDKEYPTICGTGTEDYFGGAWNFEQPIGEYGLFSTAYQGLTQVIKPDGLYQANTRFSMFRWHIADPIRFSEDLKVTIQALGWRSNHRYLPLKDTIMSVAYWYQDSPSPTYKSNFNVNDLEIV